MIFPLLSSQLGTAQLGIDQLGQIMLRLPGPQPAMPFDGSKVSVLAVPNFYSWVLADVAAKDRKRQQNELDQSRIS